VGQKSKAFFTVLESAVLHFYWQKFKDFFNTFNYNIWIKVLKHCSITSHKPACVWLNWWFMIGHWSVSRTVKTFSQDLLGARQHLNIKTNSSDLLHIQSVIQCTKFIISKHWAETTKCYVSVTRYLF